METFYFVSNGIELEIVPEHPVRISTGELTYAHYNAESFFGGTEVECWVEGKWIKGVLDTNTNRAYNKLRHLELLRSVQAMNKPKLYVVRG